MKKIQAAGKADRETRSSTPTGWPAPLSDAALRGLAGDIVSTIGPETESDPAALVVGTLTAFGNLVGAGPRFTVERTQHGLNLFTVLVGRSSAARKNSAWNNIRTIFRLVDPEWAEKQIQCGLSSGEGLIAAAAGASDRRLLFVEDEFSAVLRVMSRHRNTLSTTLRRAWDGSTLQIATKTNPILVTGAHVGLLGATTVDDLGRYLGVTDIVNGFANRTLWCCVRKSKCLPFGGRVADADLARIGKGIRAALKFASRDKEISFSKNAAQLWGQKYPELTADREGLVGAATSRAEAQTRRIATIYALLDESEEILLQHLRAALEVWRFCDESARFIFGRRQSTKLENEVLEMLRRANKKGLTRTQISNRFSRHRSSDEITAVLERLKTSGEAKRQQDSTAGRPAERWLLA